MHQSRNASDQLICFACRDSCSLLFLKSGLSANKNAQPRYYTAKMLTRRRAHQNKTPMALYITQYLFINADKDKNPSYRSIMTSPQPQRFIHRLLITFHYVRSKCLIQCCMTTATNNKYIQLYLNSIFFLPFDALSLILRCPSCCQKR